jgi:hypothetical protein
VTGPGPGERLAAAAHYVIFSREPSELGKTKLAKVLWYADVLMYRAHGRTISGASSAEKRQYGPVPVGFFEAIDQLKADLKIIERAQPTWAGIRVEYVWLEEPNLEGFSGEEVAMLDHAAATVCPHSAGRVSDATHDALWDEIPLGGKIPIGAMATVPGEITPEIMAWAVKG